MYKRKAMDQYKMMKKILKFFLTLWAGWCNIISVKNKNTITKEANKMKQYRNFLVV